MKPKSNGQSRIVQTGTPSDRTRSNPNANGAGRADLSGRTTSSSLPFPSAQLREVRIFGLEVMAAIAVWLMWLVLFSGGMLINSEPYRQAITTGPTFLDVFVAWMMTLLFWTVTNLAFLSVISALLGAAARRSRFVGVDVEVSADFSEKQKRQCLREHYLSAGMRGFGVYILMMAGLFVLATEVLTTPNSQKYMRLAATLSVIAFYGGYDPSAFRSLFLRASRLIGEDVRDDADSTTTRYRNVALAAQSIDIAEESGGRSSPHGSPNRSARRSKFVECE